jgi:hypothetical protein
MRIDHGSDPESDLYRKPRLPVEKGCDRFVYGERDPSAALNRVIMIGRELLRERA